MEQVLEYKDKTITKEESLPPEEEESPPPPPFSPKKDICQELPPHWKHARDSSGHVYYYNSITKETQWHPPNPVPPPDRSMSTDRSRLIPKPGPSSTGADTADPGILAMKVVSGGSVVCTLGAPSGAFTNMSHTTSAATISSSTHQDSAAPGGSSDQDCSELPDNECGDLPGSEHLVLTEADIVQYVKVKEEIDRQPSGQEVEYRGGTFECSKCCEIFSSEADVNAHVCTGGRKPNKGHFQCEICDKVYKWRKDLIIHKGNASKDAPLVCSVCSKAFCSKNDLDRHLRKHTVKQRGDHKCPTCGKVYRWKKDLVIHMKNVRDEKPFKCLICSKLCCTNRDLTKHFRTHAANVGEFEDLKLQHNLPVPSSQGAKAIDNVSPVKVEADIAGETSDNSVASEVDAAAALAGETQNSSDTPRGSAEADVDGSKDDAASSTDDEEELIVKKEGDKFPCPICGKLYKWKKDLQIHLNNSNGRLECSVCEKAFCMRAHLSRHMRTQHPGITPYKCHKCEKAFSQKWALNNHLRTCCKEKNFKCDACEKCFISQRRLDCHSLCHKGDKPFQCTFCEKHFRTKAHLRMHTRTHTGEKPFQCAFCGKCFTSNGELTLHTRVHTGEKPYKCTYCEKAFSGSCRLVVHIRAMHTHEKPYPCVFCAKSFVSSAQMKKHMRVHTGEKPYQCSHCEKRFSQQSARKTHEYIHTGERPFVCACKKSFTQKGLLTIHKRSCRFESDLLFAPLQDSSGLNHVN